MDGRGCDYSLELLLRSLGIARAVQRLPDVVAHGGIARIAGIQRIQDRQCRARSPLHHQHRGQIAQVLRAAALRREASRQPDRFRPHAQGGKTIGCCAQAAGIVRIFLKLRVNGLRPRACIGTQRLRELGLQILDEVLQIIIVQRIAGDRIERTRVLRRRFADRATGRFGGRMRHQIFQLLAGGRIHLLHLLLGLLHGLLHFLHLFGGGHLRHRGQGGHHKHVESQSQGNGECFALHGNALPE